MMKLRWCIAFGVAASTSLPAQISGETSVQLDIGFGFRAVLPARVTVPVGEILRVIFPRVGENLSYTWTKNGRVIPDQNSNILVINHVLSTDGGTYQCMFSSPTTQPLPSQAMVLGVGPTDRLLNLSARATIGAGSDQTLISGFVVNAGTGGKKLILRVIGPSLALFGVTNPLRAPVLRIFDASGKLYENGYAYPAVVGGPTYESDLADSLAGTGAFPIPAGTRDVTEMKPFLAGNYTAQVSSGDGTAGAVLLEIYEVP